MRHLNSVATLALSATLALFAPANAADTKNAIHEIRLTRVDNPKDTLVKAKVIDSKGDSVGSVDDVMLDKGGKPTSLKVDVGSFLGVGGKDVAMKASAFKFDTDRKVLITNMTKDQIKKLPEMKS